VGGSVHFDGIYAEFKALISLMKKRDKELHYADSFKYESEKICVFLNDTTKGIHDLDCPSWNPKEWTKKKLGEA
jgi:hypothetical protein